METLSPGDPVMDALRDCGRRMTKIALFSGAINLLTLSGSIYMLQVYDRVIPSRNMSTLASLSIIILMVAAAMQRKSLAVSVIAVGVALSTGYALAQRGPGSDMGAGMQIGRGMMGMMDMMSGCPMMGMGGQRQSSAFVEGRIAFVKAELAITDAQKGAWDAYADAIKRNLLSLQDMASTMRTVFEAKTPVERLDAHLAAMEGRTKALQDVKPTLVKLYEELTPEQKRKADEILTAMGCMI